MPWCGEQCLDHEENAETGKSKRFTIERKKQGTIISSISVLRPVQLHRFLCGAKNPSLATAL
jgi:hypothetical protein